MSQEKVRRREFDRPNIVLGAARSGTTLLADRLLARHPAIAYWAEPNFVWRYGHAYRSHDLLVAADACPPVVSYIRARFADFARAHPDRAVLEKTPANCLRVPFILAVFPRARFIHVIRDGRDVALSAAREWAGLGIPRDDPKVVGSGPGLKRAWFVLRTHARLQERIRDVRTLVEFPAHALRGLGTVARFVFPRSRSPWGPRFPGLRKVRRALTLLETCALQWDLCVRLARSACLRLPPDQYLEIRYEDLLAEPQEVLTRVLDFLQLPSDRLWVEAVANQVDRPAPPKWQTQMTPAQRAAVESLIGDTLRSLGYAVGDEV